MTKKQQERVAKAIQAKHFPPRPDLEGGVSIEQLARQEVEELIPDEDEMEAMAEHFHRLERGIDALASSRRRR